MIKHLPLILFLLLTFTVAYGQTRSDSVSSHLNADSIAKRQLIDSVKRMSSDTVARPHVDSVVKKTSVDTVIKHQPVDTITKYLSADTIKHGVDSVAKAPIKDKVLTPLKDSVAKRMAPKSGKPLQNKTVVKTPAADSPLKHSPVKTLSDEKYNILLKGEDFDNMSLAGELNHYPLPDKALKYKVQLGLNPGQITKLKDIVSFLQRKKVEMGGSIIRNEKMLDSLFHTKQIDDGTIIFYTNRYGLYLGEIRNAVLQACYKTEAILSETQIKKLESLEKSN